MAFGYRRASICPFREKNEEKNLQIALETAQRPQVKAAKKLTDQISIRRVFRRPLAEVCLIDIGLDIYNMMPESI